MVCREEEQQEDEEDTVSRSRLFASERGLGVEARMLGRLLEKITGEEDDSGELMSLERTSSKLQSILHLDATKRSQESELEVRLTNVDDEAVELTRTPSTQLDIDAAAAAGRLPRRRAPQRANPVTWRCGAPSERTPTRPL